MELVEVLDKRNQHQMALAHSLALDAIAEGIETPQQPDILRSLDCEYGLRRMRGTLIFHRVLNG